jgi:hypothetical protein
MKKIIYIMLAAIGMFIVLSNAFAKRVAPTPVAPIEKDGLIYSAPPYVRFSDNVFAQAGGYIMARDMQTQRIKWLVQIYVTKYDKLMEKDVQDVFIKQIQLAGDVMTIKDEKNNTFSLNIKTLEIKPALK